MIRSGFGVTIVSPFPPSPSLTASSALESFLGICSGYVLKAVTSHKCVAQVAVL